MSPILYTADLSPPCRAVYMVEKALNIKLEHKMIDLFENDHLKTDFLKINPRHTIPTLVDGNLVLTDSHAITSYLVSKYGKEDSLYPKDPESKALVDQMLHFDSSVAFASLLNCCGSIRLKLVSKVTSEMSTKLETTYSFLDKFLDGKLWIAVNHVTIADFHLVATVVAAGYFASFKNFPNVCNWVERCKKLSYYKDTEFSLKEFTDLFDNILKK